MPADNSLQTYYARRAAEYEQIYRKPERRGDLGILSRRLPPLFARRRVLEVACGTGYWTSRIAAAAASVLAVDINREMLDIARSKHYPRRNVRFAIGDAFSLDEALGQFSAGLACFWWSHLTKAGIPSFLDAFHARLAPGALVAVVDNIFVAGASTPISRTDKHGDTYQSRTLADGGRYEVLKNFPDEQELRRSLEPLSFDLNYRRLRYYWCVSYRVNRP